jgi:2EXR family
MDRSRNVGYALSSLPLEIRYIVWEYTWPSPMVIEPIFYRYRNGEDDSSDEEDDSSDEEESDDGQRVIILHQLGPLSTFSGNSDNIKELAPSSMLEKFQPPVALSVCQESREFTLRHYHHLHHREVASPSFYFHPKRDILWFSDNRIHDYLSTLQHSYNELLFRCTTILIDYSTWDDEKLRSDTLQSLRILGAVDCILIRDCETLRMVDEGASCYLVPDSERMAARANRYRTEYEGFLKSLEKEHETEEQRDNAHRIWCVDGRGDLY